MEHEGELAVIIGRTCYRVSDAENPLDYVLGYTCLNDVTARDLQKKDVQFTRAKSFDTFCPVGPVVETDLDPLDLQVETRVNGEVRQRGRTSMMAFPVPYLIRYISHVMTLLPGDVISTGTPAGVGRSRTATCASRSQVRRPPQPRPAPRDGTDSKRRRERRSQFA